MRRHGGIRRGGRRPVSSGHGRGFPPGAGTGERLRCFFLLVAWLAAAGCGSDPAAPPAAADPTPVGEVRDLRFTIRHGSELVIGDLPVFPYDGRDGVALGTMTYLGNGMARVLFPAEGVQAPPLPMIPALPDLPLRVEIESRDLAGTVDFCTGEVRLAFDATFQPVVFSLRPAALSVVTPLTTAAASGRFHTEVETGRVLDPEGDLKLAGVAEVPETGDPLVDGLLALPTDAVCRLESHLDFPDGRFPCPGAPPPGTADRFFLEVGKHGMLAITLLGSFVEFAYDGKGSGGYGSLGPPAGGTAEAVVEGADVRIPPLEPIAGWDGVRIEIATQRVAGGIDFCTGRMDFDFDATFTPVLFGASFTPISVVTTMTTETSACHHHDCVYSGERLDRWGDAVLVGVADVPETGDPLIDGLLTLPSDAVEVLPFHLDFLGARPACP